MGKVVGVVKANITNGIWNTFPTESTQYRNDKKDPMQSLLRRALRSTTFIYEGIFTIQSNSFIKTMGNLVGPKYFKN